MSKLKKYIGLVDFLGQVLGSRYEIVLHDLSIPEKSIIAIANGHISGRKLGGPVTDLLLKILNQGQKDNVNFIANYKGKSGNKICRSSSYFIHDKTNKIIGVLCINIDITAFLQIEKLCKQELSFINTTNSQTKKSAVTETLEGNIDELLENMLKQRLNQYDDLGQQLSINERLNLIRNLYSDGFFLLRGSVPNLAEEIKVSEPTIYRYLNRVKRESATRS